MRKGHSNVQGDERSERHEKIGRAAVWLLVIVCAGSSSVALCVFGYQYLRLCVDWAPCKLHIISRAVGEP